MDWIVSLPAIVMMGLLFREFVKSFEENNR